jgi:hypothetical protein
MEEKNWLIHIEFLIVFITCLMGFYTLNAKLESQIQKIDKQYEIFIDMVKNEYLIYGKNYQS